jgi:glycosyltransferase involved in cell wall biosynthesis
VEARVDRSGVRVDERATLVRRVAYVTMQFPSPSETFATNDVRAQVRAGLHLSAHCLRPGHARSEQLLAERDLSGFQTTHNSVAASMRGAVRAVVQPLLLVHTVRWIIQSTWRRPRHLVSSLVLLPRAFDILDELRAIGPEVVHLFWGHYPSIVGHLVRRTLPEIAISMSLNAYDLHMRYGGSVTLAREADVVRTHSRINVSAVSAFTGLGVDEIDVIYNGIELESSCPRQRQPHRIVSVGRLIAIKRVDDTIRAFAQARAQWPDATLVVMGDGPERGRLEGLCERLGVSSAVTFLGHVPSSRVAEEMRRAEILLLLSATERLPNAVKEGMANGCICITTPTPGIDELLIHGEHGFVVPHGDAAALGATIEAIFDGSVDTAAMASRARAHIERFFQVEATTAQLRDAWTRAVSRRRAQIGPPSPPAPTASDDPEARRR